MPKALNVKKRTLKPRSAIDKASTKLRFAKEGERVKVNDIMFIKTKDGIRQINPSKKKRAILE